MSELKITVINVGTGDSIFIESTDRHGDTYYALVDSNDTNAERATEIFVKQRVRRTANQLKNQRLFEFVMLSHAHLDHGQGLKNVIKRFGAKNLFYPKAAVWGGLTSLLSFANRSVNSNGRLLFHQAVDAGHRMPNLGDTTLEILWPFRGATPSTNENDNSIVLSITLDQITTILTGDAEIAVWNNITDQLPSNTTFFKVPHHGSRNGTLDGNGDAPYIDHLEAIGGKLLMAISCYPIPHGHPHQEVLDRMDQIQNNPFRLYRTDQHKDITFQTDGITSSIAASIVEYI